MRSFIRAAWTLPRAPGAPRRVWRDWVLVAVVTAIALLEAALRFGAVMWLWPSLVLELVFIALLLWRRTHPGLVALIVFGSSAIYDTVRLMAGLGATDLYTFGFMLIVIYALARWGSGRELILGGALIVLSIVRSFAFGLPTDVIGGSAVVAIPITLGAVIRYRDAARLTRLEHVRLHERERLARDLHDTVAHHVTAIALRAQAGLATNDAAAALRDIEAEASHTLREMRSLVGVLREVGGELAPTATSVETLAGGTPPVTVSVNGDLDSVPAPVATAVYRIAQEAVTNARRHAEGATAIAVDVAVAAASIRVRIHDNGAVSTRRPADGFGIVGMTERADLLGGTLTAGWDASGGWTVEATLPVGAA